MPRKCISCHEIGQIKLPKGNEVQLLKDLGFPDGFLLAKGDMVCYGHFTEDSFWTSTCGKTYWTNWPKVKTSVTAGVVDDVIEYVEKVEKQETVIIPLKSKDAVRDDIGGFDNFKINYATKLKDQLEAGWKVEFHNNLKGFSPECASIFFQEFSLDKGTNIRLNVICDQRMRIKGFVGKRPIDVSSYTTTSKTAFCWNKFTWFLIDLRNDNYEINTEDTLREIVVELGKVQLEDVKKQRTLKIASDQINNLVLKRNSFSVETILVASMLKNVSTAGYKAASEFLILPSIRHLNSVSKRMGSKHDEEYLTRVACRLTLLERFVTLQIDEMYLDGKLSYSNGKLEGAGSISRDKSKLSLGKTVQAFMIESLFGGTREIAKLLPVSTLDKGDFVAAVKEVIDFAQSCGFTIVIILTDNHKTNQSLFKNLTSVPGAEKDVWFPNPHPDKRAQKIFVSYDFVHLFKNIRNNWLCLKDESREYIFPDFDDVVAKVSCGRTHKASWRNLRTLFKSQLGGVLKTAHKLTHTSLYPTSFQKQNVKLVENVFSESTIASLITADDSAAKETASFLKIIRKWWDICNVKSKFKHRRLRKADSRPFDSLWRIDDRIQWLNNFIEWIKLWNTDQRFTGHRLSKDTFQALLQSTTVLLHVIEYVFNGGFEEMPEYLLTGKLQTDQLEQRFGKYRWLAGSNYKVSMKEVKESERKIRDRHTMLYELLKENLREEKSTLSSLFGVDPASSEPTRELVLDNFGGIFDTDYQLSLNDVEIECIHQVAGYCASKVAKKFDPYHECPACVSKFVVSCGDIDVNTYHDELQRGGLVTPSDEALILTALGVSFLIALTEDRTFADKFIKFNHQRYVLETMIIESSFEISSQLCEECGKDSQRLVKAFCRPLANTLLSGYSKMTTQKENHQTHLEKYSKKRARLEESFSTPLTHLNEPNRKRNIFST